MDNDLIVVKTIQINHFFNEKIIQIIHIISLLTASKKNELNCERY